MGLFVSGFRTSLSEQGYSVLVVGNMLTDIGALGRWMQEHDVQPDQLTPVVIAEFRDDCLALGRRKVPRRVDGVAVPEPAGLKILHLSEHPNFLQT